MTFVADKDGKLVLKGGKLFVGSPGDAGCVCCECCWVIESVAGCPAPKVNLSDNGDVQIQYLDSATCKPEPCDIKLLKDNQGSSDKTTCNLPQGVGLKKKWILKDPTTVTVKIEASLPAVYNWYSSFSSIVISSCHGSHTIYADISSDGESDGAELCPMKTINAQDTIRLEAGCWTVSIVSGDSWNGTYNKDRYTNISFEFDGASPESCTKSSCSTVTCASSDPDAPAYGKCIPSPFDENSNEEQKTIEDCVKDCNKNKCNKKTYYCCVHNTKTNLSSCEKFSQQICEATDIPIVTNEYGPYYDTLANCKNNAADCKITFNCENNRCVPHLGLPAGQYQTSIECERACPGLKYTCDSNSECVSTEDPNAPYNTIDDCLAVCIKNTKYACNDNFECYETQDTNAPYNNIEDCRTNCEQNKRFACSASYECVQSPDGEFWSFQECMATCGGGDGGAGYYCCRSLPPLMDASSCQLGPCANNQQTISGPSTMLGCQLKCQKYKCFTNLCDIKTCLPDPNGEFSNLLDCFTQCQNNRIPNDPNTDCNLAGPVDQWLTPGEYEFTCSTAPKKICIGYESRNGKPVDVVVKYPISKDCVNIQPILGVKQSPWIGNKPCDCAERVAKGGAVQQKYSNTMIFSKPFGTQSFTLLITAPCDQSEVRARVKCGDCPVLDDDGNPDLMVGGCCIEDINGNAICLGEMVTKKVCDNQGGYWFGACIDCDQNDADCIRPRGACCLDSECIRDVTAKQCNRLGGNYQGDNTTCATVKCPIPPGQGACCFQQWTKIGYVSKKTVVDDITVNDISIKNFPTINCGEIISGTCEKGTANVEVTKKLLSVLNINLATIPQSIVSKFPVKDVITNIVLPYTTCDIGTTGGNGYDLGPTNAVITSEKLIPLNNEIFITSYNPPDNLITDQSNIIFDQQQYRPSEFVNMQSVPSIGVIISSDGIDSVYINNILCDSIITQEDCDNKEGTFSDQKTCEETQDICNNTTLDKLNNKVSLLLNMDGTSDSTITTFALPRVETVSFTRAAPAPVITTSIGGPGTELKKLLSIIGIHASEGCSCNARAKTMDAWGPEICLEKIDEINGWLKEEANKRRLPFIEMAGKLIIKRAIQNAKRKMNND